jgi:hypothetical protein
MQIFFTLFYGVADSHHFNADPDPNPNPTFHFNANPDLDLDPHQSDANLRALVFRPFTASFLSLNASIVSVHGPPRLHFETLKLLNFDNNADPDPAFHSYEDQDP